MSEKIFPPSKKKLKRLAGEGRYPFSSIFHSSLFFVLGFFILSVFSFCGRSKDLFFIMLHGNALGYSYKILIFLSFALISIWIGLLATYKLGGGKLSLTQVKNPDFLLNKWMFFALLFFCSLAFIFFIPHLYVYDSDAAAFLLKKVFWQSFSLFGGLSIAFGLIDYLIRRWTFFKNAWMTAEEKKEELKEETTAKR